MDSLLLNSLLSFAYTTKSIHTTSATKTIAFQHKPVVGEFSDGHCVILDVRQDYGIVEGKAYIIDSNGNITGQFKASYNDEYSVRPSFPKFNNGKAIAWLADKSIVIIDYKGTVLVTLGKYFLNEHGHVDENSIVTSQFVDGIAEIESVGMPTKFINQNGKVVFSSSIKPFGDDGVAPLNDERRRFCDANIHKYGFLGPNGEIIIPAQFTDAEHFSEGLACVKNSDKLWGFIDKGGKFVIEPMFSNKPENFHSGFSLVRKKDMYYCYIDKTGKISSQDYYIAESFMNDYAIVGDGSWGSVNYHIIDNEMHKYPFEGIRFWKATGDSGYDEIWRDYNGRDYKEGLIYEDYAIIEPNGDVLYFADRWNRIKFHEGIGYIDEGYRNENPYCFVNRKFEVILKINISEF